MTSSLILRMKIPTVSPNIYLEKWSMRGQTAARGGRVMWWSESETFLHINSLLPRPFTQCGDGGCGCGVGWWWCPRLGEREASCSFTAAVFFPSSSPRLWPTEESRSARSIRQLLSFPARSKLSQPAREPVWHPSLRHVDSSAQNQTGSFSDFFRCGNLPDSVWHSFVLLRHCCLVFWVRVGV